MHLKFVSFGWGSNPRLPFLQPMYQHDTTNRYRRYQVNHHRKKKSTTTATCYNMRQRVTYMPSWNTPHTQVTYGDTDRPDILFEVSC